MQKPLEGIKVVELGIVLAAPYCGLLLSDLGADVIKADPTDDPSDYHQVVQIAGNIPVLVRGGGRVPDRELLERTDAVLVQGAAGIVYGRNIVQHANPAGITRALMAMLHENASVDEAEKLIA